MAHATGIIPEIEQQHGEFKQIRQQIHAHPELGFEEFQTSALVAERLKAWGYEVFEGVGGTGVVGRLQQGSSARRIGIRADMDALPIHEATGLPYASTHEGKMHACGHDGHTAILLAAARHLAQTRQFDGTLHLIFQPAEEGLGGAPRMMDDGLFERFPCDAVYALHNGPGVPVGKFVVLEGAMAASSDSVTITLTGKGSHGAMPQFGRDPVVAAASLVMALQTIVSRNVAASEAAVVTVGSIQAGSAPNVIPGEAKLLITVRALNREVRELLERRIHDIAEAQARSFGVEARVEYRHISRVLVNTPAETATMRQVITAMVGAENIITPPGGMMGSEDFSWMLERVPGCYVVIGNGLEGHGGCMIHNPGYDFNDAALPFGASLWVKLVEHCLAPTA